MADASARHLTIYVRLWAVANLLRIHVGYAASTALRGSQLDRYSVVLPLIIVLAALWPTRRAGQLTFVALALRAITNIAKGSHMSNSQLWATQHDLALLLALAAAALRKGSLETLTAADEREIIAECAPTIRLQMAVFYFASGFWKLNTSFLHSDYSCASLYLTSQLEYLPDHILFTETLSHVAQTIARLAPFVTIAVELALPLLHAFETSAKLATLGTLAFHLAIGLTPPPSNVASYGVTTCTRLFFFAPTATAAATAELVSSPLLGGIAVAAAAAALAVVRPLHAEAVSMVQGNATDYHLAWLAILCVLYCRASTHRPRVIDLKTTGTRRPVTVQGDEDEVAYVIDNACPTVRESLREMAADQYSADLTVAGCRSLTTAPDIVQALANYLNKRGELEKPITAAELLAHAAIYRKEHPLEDAGVVEPPPRRASRGLLALAVAYAFGLPILGLQEKAGCLMFSQLRMHGGSNHLLLPTALLQRALVNADPTSAFAGGVVRVGSTNLSWVGNAFAVHHGPRSLRVAREVARVPAEYIWAEKATSSARVAPPPRFLAHTLSNLGLRKLVATAVRQHDAFWLRYTRLDGVVGDEAWRTSSSGAEYLLSSAGNGTVECVDGQGEVCDARERALVLGATDAASAALAFWLEPQPNPVVDGLSEEMHCVRWG